MAAAPDIFAAAAAASREIRLALQAAGFTLHHSGEWHKPIATGGAFGRVRVALRLCPADRYLERVDGWGTVERDVDLRRYPDNPQGAIRAVMEGVA